MPRPLAGLSLMTEPAFAAAALPLFEAGEVECLEWTFDCGWGVDGIPAWSDKLLAEYARAGRLYGHGVTYSPLSGKWHERQEAWLQRFEQEVARRPYQHVSEHFGFVTAGDFHRGAPLPVPLTPQTVTLAQDRLTRLRSISGLPIGLENLAFAFGPRDVADQGAFLDAILRPTNGFLLLDVHNLYCQRCNFDTPLLTLAQSYPLDLVREMHISGGSWSPSATNPDETIRRDTHDEAVPEEVFAVLPELLARCPGTEAVFFERLGTTLNEDEAPRFREDFRRLRAIVKEHRGA